MLAINNNIQAMNISRTPNRTTTASLRQTETLSSGLRVKRAANDASGLVVSEGFRSQFTRLAQNLRNAENANDLLQVAESSLNEASRMLQRMRELAVFSADGHINDDHRQVITFEFDQLRQSIDRIAQSTTYNNQNLLAGFGRIVDQDSTSVIRSRNGFAGCARFGYRGWQLHLCRCRRRLADPGQWTDYPDAKFAHGAGPRQSG